MRVTVSADSVSYPTGCRGDPATLRSPGNTPLGWIDGLCRANPLGQPAGVRAGRTFCDPRTSCGDTNGSTLHVAKQVRRIQNPQSCRQAHRKSHLSGAPLSRIDTRTMHGVLACSHYRGGWTGTATIFLAMSLPPLHRASHRRKLFRRAFAGCSDLAHGIQQFGRASAGIAHPCIVNAATILQFTCRVQPEEVRLSLIHI